MYVYPKIYDVLVVGGGHAGIEAALAAARCGCQTLLLTINLDSIGQMSCNPAIGGLAKGHLAREIDALGGEMGINTDMTGLQFRLLNTKKGPSVRAPRAQCDKKAYQLRMKWTCERQENLDLRQGQVRRLLRQDGRVVGVETTLDTQFLSGTVILTTGTFLRGLMHTGGNKQHGGRAGEGAVNELSASLQEIGLRLGRLKTGTPPRLLRRTIDFSCTEPQPGDEPVPYFSYWKEELFHVEQDPEFPVGAAARNGNFPPGSILAQTGGQMPCHITFTTEKTAEVIRQNLHRSPMYSGIIEGIGPRYCPSIEDKIVRFADKPRHQIFLEPEGIATDEIYVNGLSTSLPFEIQIEIVRSIPGCEKAEITRPAYAVEYDFANPTQLKPSLETKVCENLFLAGQINGTSGYEEAAAQGIVAGLNAVQKIRGREPLILTRDQAYIGVLIDDLITKGTTEPYRMFTSRAEYRLLLRQDNADQRLCEIGHDLGLLPERRYRQFCRKKDAISREIDRLESTFEGPHSLAHLLKRPEIQYRDLPHPPPTPLDPEVADQAEVLIKYAGYIERQHLEVAKFKGMESRPIPEWIDYDKVPNLRNEARQKLKAIQPHTLGQASRISGVSPADISIVMVWMKRGQAA